MSSGKIISNRTMLNNDTAEEVDRYIDQICSDPDFLCKNKEMCGTSTTIYSSVENVNEICSDLVKSSKCDNDFKECVVTTTNLLDDSQQKISTSFVNIIIPIPEAYDNQANQKFLRLPSLSSSKKPKSNDICNICACMNRFSTSPGSGGVINEKSYTSPGQNTCMYPEFIEHYYYPLVIENINNKLKNAPPVKLGKYTVLNSNIIYAHTEEELLVTRLYDILIKNGISQKISVSFIKDSLYKNDKDKAKELDLYIMDKDKTKKLQIGKGMFYENITFFYILLAVFIVLLIFNLLR